MLTKKQSGFTLVEVAVVAPMMIIIALGILALLITLINEAVLPNKTNLLMANQQKALQNVETDVTSGSNFLSTLPANFSYYTALPTTQPDLDVLYIQGYDQVIDPSDATRTIPAFIGSPPCNSTTSLNKSNIYPVVIVYFVENGALYRRTLTDTRTAAACGTRLAKQTCPVGATDASCKAKDRVLISDSVTQFKVSYYSGETATADISTADTVQITLVTQTSAAGNIATYTAKTRASTSK